MSDREKKMKRQQKGRYRSVTPSLHRSIKRANGGLIVALDVKSSGEAKRIVKKLGRVVDFYKVAPSQAVLCMKTSTSCLCCHHGFA